MKKCPSGGTIDASFRHKMAQSLETVFVRFVNDNILKYSIFSGYIRLGQTRKRPYEKNSNVLYSLESWFSKESFAILMFFDHNKMESIFAFDAFMK